MKLFCLPCAGGTVDFYDDLGRYLKDYGFDIVCLEYAGHGKRRKEAFYRDFRELAADMAYMIQDELKEQEEYALLGYSMGCISVLEIVRHMNCQNAKLPQTVILAAHAPTRRKELIGWADSLSDEEVKSRMMSFGGIPESLANNNTYWRVYLPVYREDFRLIANYDFEHIEFESEIPALIMYSERDIPTEEVLLWDRIWKKRNRYVVYEGNHFFIDNNSLGMAKDISIWSGGVEE